MIGMRSRRDPLSSHQNIERERVCVCGERAKVREGKGRERERERAKVREGRERRWPHGDMAQNEKL